MSINTLTRNTWYRITSVEGGGIRQITDAMKVPSGVVVRNTTLVLGPNNVSESMTFVENLGIRQSENPGFYELCSSSTNEAID